MTIPAHARSADFTSYGGDVNKRNYLGEGNVDPETDFGAADLNRTAADLASVVRTIPFCVITFTQDDTGTADPTVNKVFMQTGVRTSDYDGGAPPSGFPSVTRNNDGDVTITFSSSYADPYGNTATLNLASAEGGTSDGGAAAVVSSTVATASTVNVLTFVASSGAAATDRAVTVVIY
jgi:hypothetical protein